VKILVDARFAVTAMALKKHERHASFLDGLSDLAKMRLQFGAKPAILSWR